MSSRSLPTQYFLSEMRDSSAEHMMHIRHAVLWSLRYFGVGQPTLRHGGLQMRVRPMPFHALNTRLSP